jgi:hypothetical protein
VTAPRRRSSPSRAAASLYMTVPDRRLPRVAAAGPNYTGRFANRVRGAKDRSRLAKYHVLDVLT